LSGSRRRIIMAVRRAETHDELGFQYELDEGSRLSWSCRWVSWCPSRLGFQDQCSELLGFKTLIRIRPENQPWKTPRTATGLGLNAKVRGPEISISWGRARLNAVGVLSIIKWSAVFSARLSDWNSRDGAFKPRFSRADLSLLNCQRTRCLKIMFPR
jgi:hypothetical protein